MDEPLTNADKIRSMTDEELAKTLSDIHNKGYLMGKEQKDKHSAPPLFWLEWLRQKS